MERSIYKDENIEFVQTSQSVIFNCSHCGQMGHEAPVRSKEKKLLKSYHAHCAEAVIYRIKYGNKETISKQTLGGGITVPPLEEIPESEPKKSYLRPVLDDELERKKNKLKSLLSDAQPEAIAQEMEPLQEKVEAKPKAKIELSAEGKIFITHKYDTNLIDKYHFIKQIKFNKEFKVWECNIKDADYETCRFFLKIFKDIPRFEWLISEDAYQAIKNRVDWHEKNMRESKEIKELKAQVDADIDLSHMKIEPYPYQKVGISFLDKVKGVGLLGDSMGLGKSGQAIGYTSLNNLHTIVVCPASLKYNWKKEVEKFTNKTAVVLTEFVATDLDPKNKMADYVIINYEQLEKYEKYLTKAKFDCVILDESQYIMNLQAKRTKAVFKYFKKCKHRLCVSGTPIKNRPLEFYAQLKFLRPDLFSNKMKFALRYCDAKETPFGWDMRGSSNLDELNRKIAPFYIRRLKQDVLKELPPKTVTVLDLEMGVTEKAEYLKIQREFDRIMNDGISQYGNTYEERRIDGAHLAKLMELKQFCSKIKVAKVVEFVKEFVESSENRKIIVFSQFIATQKALRDAFPGNSVSLLGEDSAEERNAAVEKFQSDPNIRVFVGSTIAAGVGLTLTAADTVVFADLMWSPADHEQAADRVHRISQENPVFIYYMVYKDSIESMIWHVVGNKLGVLSKALDGKEAKDVHPDVIKMVFNSMLNNFRSKKRS